MREYGISRLLKGVMRRLVPICLIAGIAFSAPAFAESAAGASSSVPAAAAIELNIYARCLATGPRCAAIPTRTHICKACCARMT